MFDSWLKVNSFVFMFQMTIQKHRKIETEKSEMESGPPTKKRKQGIDKKCIFSLIYQECQVNEFIPIFVYVIPDLNDKFEFSFVCDFSNLIIRTLHLPPPSLWDQSIFSEIKK
jgi:hypothetical protein